MVKGLLALFFRVFKSSGPSPNTPFITSTNDGNNHNKQHNQSKNKSALKILDFSRIPLVILEMTKVVS